MIELFAKTTSPMFGGFGSPIVAGIVALAVAWIMTPWVRSFAMKQGAMDDPTRDDRRIHKAPLPRWGGLAIYAGILVALLVVLPFAFYKHTIFPNYLIGILLIAGFLVVFGAFDDLHQYSAKIQAPVLLGAGILVQYFSGTLGQVQIRSFGIPLSTPGAHIALGLAAVPITAIYIFVITKTMDTIDGVDGLASGIATISATTLAIIAVYGGQPRVALVAAAIAGASLGFLKHNYNPAKIIMGTGGAYVLGFMLACISIVGAFKTAAAFAIFIPMFVFGVPLADAVQVMIRRKLSGVPITQADKRHVHHALLGKGLSQRQTVWVLYFCAALLCAVLLLVIRAHA
jgi:UDP-GlcNAc:undecaprenyl-phosphate/decaprenyl-phosphate GlcNAc-1-phosphate transferase